MFVFYAFIYLHIMCTKSVCGQRECLWTPVLAALQCCTVVGSDRMD